MRQTEPSRLPCWRYDVAGGGTITIHSGGITVQNRSGGRKRVGRLFAITVGEEWGEDLSAIAPERWPDAIAEYRRLCRRHLENDCRQLLRMIGEGERVGWAGYGDRDSYIRDGLGLDLNAVDLALAGLRHDGIEVTVGFREAQRAGRIAAARAKR